MLNGSRVLAIYVFLKWRPAAILDFGGSEIWRHFCFRYVGFRLWVNFLVYNCNCDRVMAVKVNFQNGGRRHLGFLGSEIWRHQKSRAASIYLQTKFREDISKGGRVMAVYVFLKWRPPPSWIYFRCRFSWYSRFWIVALYVLAKFDKSISFCGCVIEVCPNIQNGGCPPSWISIWLFWTTHEVLLSTWSLYLNFMSIGFIFAKISPIEHFANLA